MISTLKMNRQKPADLFDTRGFLLYDVTRIMKNALRRETMRHFGQTLRMLVLCTVLAGMLLFQMPMVMLGLLTLGVVDLETIRKKRPYVIVVIFILSAIFSPPDVFSQLLLAIPSWILFELSLLFYSARQR